MADGGWIAILFPNPGPRPPTPDSYVFRSRTQKCAMPTMQKVAINPVM